MTENEICDIDDFAERFFEIAKEARRHGIASYMILHTTDPIAMISHTRYVNTADPVLAMGMVQAAQLYVQDEFFGNSQEEEEMT